MHSVPSFIDIIDFYFFLSCNITGITIHDIGLKMGLNGIDNAKISFDNVRVPRENLLNKDSEVNPATVFFTFNGRVSRKLASSVSTLSMYNVYMRVFQKKKKNADDNKRIKFEKVGLSLSTINLSAPAIFSHPKINVKLTF